MSNIGIIYNNNLAHIGNVGNVYCDNSMIMNVAGKVYYNNYMSSFNIRAAGSLYYNNSINDFHIYFTEKVLMREIEEVESQKVAEQPLPPFITREHIRWDIDLTPQKADDRDPPKIAEFLLTALTTTRATEAMIGDLNEQFTLECKDIGRDRAARLYWARTLRSLWPLLRRAIGKAVKWGAVIAAVRRLF